MRDWVRDALNFAYLGFLLFFVMRPMLGWISCLERRAASGGPLPGRIPPEKAPAAPPPPDRPGAGAAAATPPASDEAQRISEEVYRYASEDPEKTADLLRIWMKERR